MLPAACPGDLALLRGLFVLSADMRAGALILDEAAHQMGSTEVGEAMRHIVKHSKRREAG